MNDDKPYSITPKELSCILCTVEIARSSISKEDQFHFVLANHARYLDAARTALDNIETVRAGLDRLSLEKDETPQ